MKQTEHYGMNLPEDSDYAQIEQLNVNTRIIDAQLFEGVSALSAHDISAQSHPDLRKMAEAAAPMKDVYTKQETDARIGAAVGQHDTSEDAHADLRLLLSELDARLAALELKYATDITGHPFSITFRTLDGLIVSGVWNEPLARLEF